MSTRVSSATSKGVWPYKDIHNAEPVRVRAKASTSQFMGSKCYLHPAHHNVDSTHVAHAVSKQAAHLFLPPVGCCMQGRPPIDVPAVHIDPALQQHPDPVERVEEDGGKQTRKGEEDEYKSCVDLMRYNNKTKTN